MNIAIQEIQNLYAQVKSVLSKYRKVNELTGENFNVFKILKLESSEVRMHSSFIAELLNPKGSHGQGDIFLRLFIKRFCFKKKDFDISSCYVEIEKHTGFINEDRTEGGRLDIFICDKHNNHIIIENKIYAGDQQNQLVRYNSYSLDADILYLTLDGKKPSENSRGNLVEDEHFKCISYKKNIIDWLVDCRKEMAIFPIIREAITHYINLIKYLTNQTVSSAMQKELTDVIKSNLEASIAIVNNMDKVLDEVSSEFGRLLESELNILGLICYYQVDFDEKYSGIYITKPEWNYLNIAFQFQAFDKDMIYGFCHKDSKAAPISDQLRNELYCLPYNIKKHSGNWPWFNNVDNTFKNWSNCNTWITLTDGTMMKMIKEKTEFLLDLTKGIEL
jgi:hypothetical protein